MSGSNSSAGARPDEPLGLTVHSLPLPQEAALADEQRTRSGRLKMLLVMLVCAAPVIASYFTYYVIRPEGRRNYGELIEPQRALPAPLQHLAGQWLLVSVAPAACDAACEKHLYLQRQLREGLGRDKERMDWVWLVPDTAPVRDSLAPALKGATVVHVDPAVLAAWLQPAAGQGLKDHLYVVDPLGHWMMRFPAGQDIATAPRVKRDLERLMRGSAGWDKPGRP
ncbi:MAG: hypothetical protein HY854_18935 [Burkholderiales bacterium]|nr:hypothetical protein [Burkholderiales bacterium]